MEAPSGSGTPPADASVAEIVSVVSAIEAQDPDYDAVYVLGHGSPTGVGLTFLGATAADEDRVLSYYAVSGTTLPQVIGQAVVSLGGATPVEEYRSADTIELWQRISALDEGEPERDQLLMNVLMPNYTLVPLSGAEAEAAALARTSLTRGRLVFIEDTVVLCDAHRACVEFAVEEVRLGRRPKHRLECTGILSSLHVKKIHAVFCPVQMSLQAVPEHDTLNGEREYPDARLETAFRYLFPLFTDGIEVDDLKGVLAGGQGEDPQRLAAEFLKFINGDMPDVERYAQKHQDVIRRLKSLPGPAYASLLTLTPVARLLAALPDPAPLAGQFPAEVDKCFRDRLTYERFWRWLHERRDWADTALVELYVSLLAEVRIGKVVDVARQGTGVSKIALCLDVVTYYEDHDGIEVGRVIVGELHAALLQSQESGVFPLSSEEVQAKLRALRSLVGARLQELYDRMLMRRGGVPVTGYPEGRQ
jgi:hypothetical protein